jgi:hypothetical protein
MFTAVQLDDEELRRDYSPDGDFPRWGVVGPRGDLVAVFSGDRIGQDGDEAEDLCREAALTDAAERTAWLARTPN